MLEPEYRSPVGTELETLASLLMVAVLSEMVLGFCQVNERALLRTSFLCFDILKIFAWRVFSSNHQKIKPM
jgi:hypothetical protein